MNIVCCQFDMAWEQKAVNHDRAEALLRAANIPAGSLVLLPEMFATGFSMDIAKIDDGETRETANFLGGMARELNSHVLGGLVTSAPDGRGRNEAVLFGPDGREIVRYHKMHPFSYGGETKYYSAGQSVVLYEWQSIIGSPFICYDLRFPEVFRSALVRGAQLFTLISSWPAVREAAWLALLKARAIENQAYVAAVNRCGSDPRLEYSGRSLIIDPRGEVLADAGNDEGIISAELDLPALLAFRREFPARDDIHPEYVYSGQ
jgi:omega-amidase